MQRVPFEKTKFVYETVQLAKLRSSHNFRIVDRIENKSYTTNCHHYLIPKHPLIFVQLFTKTRYVFSKFN